MAKYPSEKRKNKKRSSNYSRGFSWGKETIKREYRILGKKGIALCDKTAFTCEQYGTNQKIKRTKKGKKLTSSLRAYYRGISRGMLAGYNDILHYN